MQNKKSKVKKVALTLALAQIMSVGAIPLNTIVGSSNANVYAATTKEMHKWKKFNIDTINIGTKKYRYIPQGGEIELVNDGSFDEFDEELSGYPKIEKKGAENKASYIEVGDIVSGYPYFSGSVPGVPIYTGVVTNINFGRLIINRNYTQEEIMTSKKVKGSYIEEVTSSDSNAYPKSGEKDGFWYEYSGKESIQVEDEADKFIPKTKTLNVIQGESVDLTTGLTNKPESASVEIKKPVDTKEPGQKTGIITVKFKDSSKKDVEITVNVEKKLSQADKFIPEVKKVEVRKGDPVDITKAITNLPEGATVKVKTPVDTKEPGQKTGEVTVEFKDKSTKDVKIPVTVKDWNEMGVITPVPEISEENIEKEVVKVNGIVNLLDNIKGLPEDAKVEDVTSPKIDTSVAKETEGRVKVTFKDGSSRVVTIPVLIEDLEADKFNPEIKDVTVRKGDPVDITKAITNLPEGATVKVKTPVDTKEPGQKTGEVTVEFKDKSTKDVKIPVTVKDWNEMGVITPVENIIDNIKEEVVEKGGKIDLTDNVIAKNAKSFEDVTTPEIDTNVPGQYKAKVKVTFEDGSSRIVIVPVIVLENTKDLTDKISDLEKQLRDKEKELEEAKNSCNTDKAELEKKIADKEKELENLKNATDAEKAKLQEEIDNLKKQIEDLNKKIADKDKEISELKDKIADLEKDKKALEDDKAKLQGEIDKLKKENSDLKDSDKDNADKIKELEDKITELEARDILKQDEIDRLEDEIAKLKDQLQEALYEKEQLKKENEEVKDKIKELQDLLKGVVGSNKNKDEKIKELEKEIADLKAKENSCKPQDNSKVKELEDKIKELEKELENAKKKKEE
ncbi:Rib/alpha/Esp surface antigen repeat-containing protein [Peptoniphilus asaccharolyticus DSM 20463]|uniref:Rib/alpha/Esp surface antigen repeat-containing protein n=1 Tax=Peptoniphilus asaccharolyticus DSM 20463 TaxID=573058 RepID=A0A1W1UCR0_PEPAS|nr:Rib/alpha-like domain-containing protein [Peptoniphilus asaccharolyticus]MBL7576435.1 hypothetical protein [Peptoniphilus asaccharolyticus]SMB78584.1 Rib/alpha/Esp surface antigen repeat-containing protein [Peptoniphilus asaccharolyticus DSM 20463]